MPRGFGERFYHHWVQTEDLCSFRVIVQETDLFILAQQDLTELATQSVIRYRTQLEEYIQRHPEFQTSFQPVEVDDDAPPLIHTMASAAKCADVGPFAAVAGAVAEYVGQDLLRYSPEVIVENGGDIFAASQQSRVFGIYAGNSPLTGKIALKIDVFQMPCGVCTSSGTVGPSFSFGRADAAIVIAKSAALADACATALGNRVFRAADLPNALAYAEQTAGIDGVVVIIGDQIGAWGKIQLVKTSLS